MTAQELKNSILQLAVQGKLVPQNADDEPAAELLKRIQIEKTIAVNAGIIKKDKKLSEITEAEIPYDIPDTWEWLRLGQLCQLLDGEKKSGVKCPYLEAKYLRGKIEGSILESGKFVKKGTRLILVDGENSGEVFFATEDGYMGSTFKVLYIPDAIYAPYVLNFLLLKKQLFRNRKTGAAIPHLNKELFFNLLIPIPPLAEQERIVAKIEELLPLAAEYDEAEQRLSALNTNFPEMLRKSILQQAVQGKLTARDPSDEPALELLKRIRSEKAKLIAEGKVYREKELKDVFDDDIPFDIPDQWEWCKLGELTRLITKGSSPSWQGVAYTTEDKGILFVTSENVGVENMLLEKRKYVEAKFNEMHPSSILQKGDLLTNIVGASIGRTALFNEDIENANVNQAVCIIRLVNTCLSDYLLMYLNSATAIKIMTDKSVDSARANLSLTSVTNLLIPLPPLNEQKRIVERVEELLDMYDALK